MDERGGKIKISFANFFAQSAKNAVGEPFSLLLISGIRKIWMRGSRECQVFQSKIFCLTVSKNFVGQPFYCFTTFGYRKNFCSRGLCHDSLSKFFVSQCRENFVGEPFCAVFQQNSGSQKFMDKRGEFQDFRSQISCLAVPKTSVEQPDRVSLILGMENFYASEGCVTTFCQKFLAHSADKFRGGTVLCCVSEHFR